MLDLLKQFHGEDLTLPERAAHRPDKDRLAQRYEKFLSSGLG